MAKEKISSAEQQKRFLAENMWLAYFNSYLYENGMLTESQRNRISTKIDSRKESISDKKQK